jgi:hypothetical protein
METLATSKKVLQEKEFPIFRYRSCCPGFLKRKRKKNKNKRRRKK